MAYEPISNTVPQYAASGSALASAYYLKGYEAGTTTPLSMGTDTTPTSTLAKCKLNSLGYPISNAADETSVFIPHFNEDYKLALYSSETDADNNTFANAVWVVDNIDVVSDPASANVRSYATVAAAQADSNLSAGDTIIIEERSNAMFDVIAATTNDGYSVLEGTASGTSFDLRKDGNRVNVKWFGAKGDGTTDDHGAIDAAVTYLAGLTWPGGVLYFPKTDDPYMMSTGIDFHDILFTEQGLTVNSPGATLPNGEIARNVTFGLVGDFATIKCTSGFSGSYLFKFGEYQSLSLKQSMKFFLEGLEIVGPGAIGHSATAYIAGAGGYTSSADANKGTDNTSVTCIVAEDHTPGSYTKQTNIRLFNKGIELTFGFGFEFESGSIQYCNYGIHAKSAYTNLNLGEATEIELCGVGLFVDDADNIYLSGSIIEANVCAILLYLARFVEANGAWFEGNVDGDLIIRGDSGSPGLANRQINFNGCVGPADTDLNGGLIGFHINRCAIGNSYTFATSTGNDFEDIVFEDCTYDSDAGGFDLTGLSVSGVNDKQDVRVIGRTQNADDEDFGVKDVVNARGFYSTALPSAQKAFDIIVPNTDTSARIEIKGYKTAIPSAQMMVQSQHYVGALFRDAGNNTIVQFSTGESATTNYTSTGVNVPITVATPTTTITGTATGAQTVAVEFATGTAVSGTAKNFYEVWLYTEAGELSIVKG